MAALLRQVGSNVIRARHYVLDPVTGRYVRTVLLEPAATNLLLHSCDLSASQTAWGSASNFTVAAALSIFAGHTAWRHQNLGLAGSAGRAQPIGTLTGQPETASAIVENVDATTTELSIFDSTLQAHVCWGRLTWATGQASIAGGTGTVLARKLASAGPNGGPVYRLMVTGTGTAGNQRRVFIYPSGTSQNTQTAIVHHVQHETVPVATSPIVTTTAAVPRSADVLTFPWPHAPQAMTGYLRFVDLGAAQSPSSSVLLQIGQLGQAPRLFVYHPAGAAGYQVILALASGTAGSGLTTGPGVGDRVELLWRLYADGSVRIEQSINGGTPVVAARSSAIGLPAAWSGQVMRLSGVPGFSGNEAPAAWLGAVIESGSDWSWDYMRFVAGF